MLCLESIGPSRLKLKDMLAVFFTLTFLLRIVNLRDYLKTNGLCIYPTKKNPIDVDLFLCRLMKTDRIIGQKTVDEEVRLSEPASEALDTNIRTVTCSLSSQR